MRVSSHKSNLNCLPKLSYNTPPCGVTTHFTFTGISRNEIRNAGEKLVHPRAHRARCADRSSLKVLVLIHQIKCLSELLTLTALC